MGATLTKDDALKAAIWLVPIIFTAGGLLWQTSQAQNDLRSLDSEFHDHEKLESHPVSAVQLEDHKAILQELMTEQRAMRDEQTSQAIDISAICQATGARCQ